VYWVIWKEWFTVVNLSVLWVYLFNVIPENLGFICKYIYINATCLSAHIHKHVHTYNKLMYKLTYLSWNYFSHHTLFCVLFSFHVLDLESHSEDTDMFMWPSELQACGSSSTLLLSCWVTMLYEAALICALPASA
jgi:hypothetical protein